jgi:hypothetical protein
MLDWGTFYLIDLAVVVKSGARPIRFELGSFYVFINLLFA